MSIVKEILRPLTEEGTALTREQSRAVLNSMLAGETPEIEAAAFLSALATRGELAPELAGFVDVMRANSTPVPLTDAERESLVDIVGTGGGRRTTFNISSGAAIVAAGAGARVAKHGNRAVTSQVGSADVLEALGVPITLSPELAVECLRETGFVFFHAPTMHPAMKAVAPLRRALGFRTIFNLCGPLTNPARARIQVIGTLTPSRCLLLGRTLVELATERVAFVVNGTDGLDELTLNGESITVRVEETPQGHTIKAARVAPEMAGLERATLDQISGGNAQQNAAILYDIVTGVPGPRRDVVLFNAAAALVACGMAADLKEGVLQARESIDSGQAAATLAKLRAFGARWAGK